MDEDSGMLYRAFLLGLYTSIRAIDVKPQSERQAAVVKSIEMLRQVASGDFTLRDSAYDDESASVLGLVAWKGDMIERDREVAKQIVAYLSRPQ